MAKRGVVQRDHCDGTAVLHEVVLRTWRASVASAGGKMVFVEAESWYAARESAKALLGTDAILLEEVEG
jgi:hypothetical protein